MSVSGVELRAAWKSAASTSLDRSAVNLALMMMTVVVDALLGRVSQIHATTVLHVTRTAAVPIRVSVSRGLLVPDVSTRQVPLSRRR